MNSLHRTQRSKAKSHILRRIYLLEHVIEGTVEVTGRRGRRPRQLLDDSKGERGYLKLKAEEVDRS
jgi:hypothetical protein